jgi:BirA family biotin operon repressor/biotin-[acetyl-CoA-carboxylase] ligase
MCCSPAPGDYAKLAGILIELASDRRGTQAVIGIGLNLMAPAADLPQAALGSGRCWRQRRAP